MRDPVGLVLMRYAFPCAEISVRLGHITQEEYDALEAALLAGESFPRTRLERFFPAAVRRMKEVAEREGILDYWSLEALHAYFLGEHTRYIDAGDGMLGEMMACEKDLCRCRIGEVLQVVEGNEMVLRVRTNEGEETVLGRYLPTAKKGDIVVSHRRFATEILDGETAARYGSLRT